jgi:hypothetical protein
MSYVTVVDDPQKDTEHNLHSLDTNIQKVKYSIWSSQTILSQTFLLIYLYNFYIWKILLFLMQPYSPLVIL